MSKLLIATHNPAKFAEIKEYLHQFLPKLKIISLTDLKIHKEPKEIGKTFVENAQLKAEYYGKLSGLPTISDDGGLMIDALGGEPGIHSNRWPGHRGSDEELINYCLEQLKSVPPSKRGAQFQTSIFFYDPLSKKRFNETGTVRGRISETPSKKRQKGYPYRSVFIVDTFGKFYLDLSKKEHTQINHRFYALKILAQELKKLRF